MGTHSQDDNGWPTHLHHLAQKGKEKKKTILGRQRFFQKGENIIRECTSHRDLAESEPRHLVP